MNKKQLLKICRDSGKELKAKAGPGLEHYLIVCTDGSVHWQIDDACFSGFGSQVKLGTVPAYLVFWHTQADELPGQREYFRWLFRKSPYADAYVYKTSKRVFEEPTVIDCNFSPNFVIGAAILCRYRREYPKLIEQFNLFKKDLGEDLALVLMHFFKGQDKDTFVKCAVGGGHDAMHPGQMGQKAIVRYLKRDQVKGIPTVAERNFAYRALCKMWGSDVSYGANAHPLKFPEPNVVAKVDGWGGQNQLQAYSYDKLPAFLSEFLKLNNLEKVYEAK